MADDTDPFPALTRSTQALLRIAEDGIYIGVGLLLTVGGIALLIQAAVTLVTSMDAGVEEAVKATLDLLLLVFIFVELLGAVRSTVRERKLVAEPFLIIGIIASIKEIVVISISAKDDFGSADGSFEDAMLEVGILAGLVVALALAMFLSRLKEREPEE
ncbi:MAG: phosphate-starvation-inducible PsiE family protein [Actinomycetota bacterium]|nr:phosphate-starvation-inducible PsiE family protein [Actinomycetota bacterium]